MTITSPYVQYKVDSNTFTMGNTMPESTPSPSQRLFGFGLRARGTEHWARYTVQNVNGRSPSASGSPGMSLLKLSPAGSTAGLNGLSHEMGLAFDGMHG